MSVERGELWWVELDPVRGSEIAKTRPCLVLSSNLINQHRRTVVVVPLSSSPAIAPPLLVPIECGGRPVVAVTDQIRAIAKERLRRRIGRAAEPAVEAVEEALRQVLEL